MHFALPLAMRTGTPQAEETTARMDVVPPAGSRFRRLFCGLMLSVLVSTDIMHRKILQWDQLANVLIVKDVMT
uniref:Uncharacterized protein n=1 Tax=Spironucleus salmonicida TaxID=348837 RepID=V6LUJ2_9EUKA|eukprot:EST47928.1 Hypothetical protein SS50377_11970 [Spironucleus salmonicida]